ncbi:MAG: hypothetical protein Ta2F_10930 [Termitinemataceae bacterium]|nr:MAG: hypothetical protein Ta2F_10930 [Termitinemataceae bacterium]
MRNTAKIFIFFLSFVSLAITTCGIEDYKYLQPVTDIVAIDSSGATLRLPNTGATYTISFPVYGSYPNISSTSLFQNYAIYYRIYKSSQLIANVNTQDARSLVNSTLASDYTTFAPYTDINNNNTSSIDSLFTNRHYFSLGYDGAGNLHRTSPNNSFYLNPDPYFINSYEIRTTTPTVAENYDVVDITTEKSYTYAAMYIVAIDFNPNTLTPIYSNPSFINIFMLPQPFEQIAVTGVTIQAANATTYPIYPLNAIVTPLNATNTTVTWTSSDETIAMVDGAWKPTTAEKTLFGIGDGNFGLVYGIAPGTVTITATTADGSKTADYDVTVTGKAVSSITLDQPSLSLKREVGAEHIKTLTVTCSPTDASNQDLEWESANTNIATVVNNNDGTATVTGIAVGTTSIRVRAKYGPSTAVQICTVNVSSTTTTP